MSTQERPNVVLFVADQWRGKEVGYRGHQMIETPHLDRLAAEGGGFRNCFTQDPVCTPSRCSFATGWYPHVSGHRTMHHMLRRHEPNLLRYFKEAGYHVWWGGKNDMIPLGEVEATCDERVDGHGDREVVHGGPWEPGHRLFHTFLWGEVPKNHEHVVGDEYVTEQAVEFIERPHSKPFFMLVNQSLPHPPYAVCEPYYSMYDRGRVPLPIRPPVDFAGKPRMLPRLHERMRIGKMTEEELRELVAVYYGMITKTDHNLGCILDALQETGAWDNTIVVATSDHGDYAGDYGVTEKAQNTFEDVLANVPLAIRVPGHEPLPAVSDALVETLDIFGTLTEACGVEVGHTNFSRSLLPVLAGETTEHRDHVFTEGGARREEVHTHETDLPEENIYWARLGVQMNEPECHGKAVMIRSKDWKYVRRLYDTDELYDLTRDPEEVRNVIDDPKFEPVRRELAEAMLDWFLETGDQVPWRWDLRGSKEPEPPWSRAARRHWFAGSDGSG